MSNFYTEDYLEHHGVLGMKWGSRKQVYRTSTTPRTITTSHKKAQARATGAKFISKKLKTKDAKASARKRIIIGMSAAAVAITGAQVATTIFATGGTGFSSG